MGIGKGLGKRESMYNGKGMFREKDRRQGHGTDQLIGGAREFTSYGRQ